MALTAAFTSNVALIVRNRLTLRVVVNVLQIGDVAMPLPSSASLAVPRRGQH